MTAFASPTELASFESGDAAAALAWASEFIRDYCGQSFERVVGDVEVCDPRPDFTVQLRQGPVTAVSRVEVRVPGPDGALVWADAPAFEWLERGRVTVFSTPAAALLWPRRPGLVRVTYDHGFETIPEALKQVTLEIAAQKQINPASLTYRKIGDKNLGFGPNAGVVLSALQRAVLDRYAIEEVA